MQRIERFLKHPSYAYIIYAYAIFSWSFYEPHEVGFNLINVTLVGLLVLFHFFLLVFYKNTAYALPVVFSFLFIVNQSNMTLDTVGTLSLPIVAFILVVSSYVIHIIRYKVKFKKGILFNGLMLLAVAYMIPLLYTPFSFKAFFVSLAGFIYLFFYLFYKNTLEIKKEEIFKLIFLFSLAMTYQFVFYFIQGFIINDHLPFYERLASGWGRNLGWANINDLCFYTALTIPSYIYFIIKKKNNWMYWLLLVFPILTVILSTSRGGLIGFSLAALGMLYIGFRHFEKEKKKELIIFLVSVVILLGINYPIITGWIGDFSNSTNGTITEFSTHRLFIYDEAIQAFLKYPIFGGGWVSIEGVMEKLFIETGLNYRLFMYHSTLFHTLATMGLFGFFGLVIYYVDLSKFLFKNLTLEKRLLLIGFIASQVHGLIDNVQFAVPYSFLIVWLIGAFENSNETDFIETNHIFSYQKAVDN